jgi:hypothetical protein
MRKTGMMLLGLALTMGACGTSDLLTAPERAQFDGGGTYGSGGKNLIAAGDGTGIVVVEAEDGGGTYGSGGRTAGETGAGGLTSTMEECSSDERGGGSYGSGGRAGECTVTEPKL